MATERNSITNGGLFFGITFPSFLSLLIGLLLAALLVHMSYQRKIKAAESTLRQANLTIGDLLDKLGTKTEKIYRDSIRLERLNNQIDNLSQQVENLTKELETCGMDKERLNQELSSLQLGLRAAKENNNLLKRRMELDERRFRERITHRDSLWKVEIKNYNDKLDSLQKEIDVLNHTINKYESAMSFSTFWKGIKARVLGIKIEEAEPSNQYVEKDVKDWGGAVFTSTSIDPAVYKRLRASANLRWVIVILYCLGGFTVVYRVFSARFIT